MGSTDITQISSSSKSQEHTFESDRMQAREYVRTEQRGGLSAEKAREIHEFWMQFNLRETERQRAHEKLVWVAYCEQQMRILKPRQLAADKLLWKLLMDMPGGETRDKLVYQQNVCECAFKRVSSHNATPAGKMRLLYDLPNTVRNYEVFLEETHGFCS